MKSFIFSMVSLLGSVIYAEDSNKNDEINFNDPAFIERVNENMYSGSPDELFRNMSPEAQKCAQNVMLGGND